MDIEKLTHTGYRTSVIVAVILSCMLVTFVALLGRGTLNLKGALVVDEPTPVTVIATVEGLLDKGVTIRNIIFLRKEESNSTKPYYDYQVSTSDKKQYLARMSFDDDAHIWTVLHFESLHGNPTR